MAKKFLTHIDLVGNQLIKASFEKLSADPSTNLFAGRMYYNTDSNAIKIYDGTAWAGIGEIVSIVGTTNEVEVSVVDGVATIGLPDNIHVNVTGDLTGNADTATSADYATDAGTANYATSAGNASTADYATSAGSAATATSADYATDAGLAYSVAADSVVLGTSTIGDYVAIVDGNDGVSVTGGAGEGTNITIANTDKGSDQNIFKNFEVLGGSTISADQNNDTVILVPGDGISITANTQGDDSLEFANTGVLSVTGTTNEIDVDVTTGDITVSFSDTVIFPGTVTLNADPTQALEAATKQYVDGMAAGLDWHEAAHLLYDDISPTLSGTTGTLVIDGHAALTDANDGYRILITQGSGNSGIYRYNDDGDNWTLTRAVDADAYTELEGAAIFIMEGTTYGATAWIQSNHYLTDFTGQTWTQFSGTGTYVAGNGIELLGNVFSIDTDVTVDVSSTQTLTNKTLTSPVVSGLYLSDNNIVIEGTTDTHEMTLNFTDPTADRTITFKDESGTVALTSDITSAIDALTTSDIEEGTNLYFTDERAQDAVGDNISGSNSLSATYDDNAGTFSFDTTLATTSYMSKTSGLAVDISAVETKLTTDGYTKKAAGNVGNGVNTSFAISHNLNTRDVVVNVYDNSTYDTVECDVVRTDVDTVTVSFAVAPTTNAYRVVVIG